MKPIVVDEVFIAFSEGAQSVEMIEAWHLSDGTRIELRPVQPQDGLLLSAMMARLSSQTKYNRFHGTVNNLTSTHLRYMSCVDQLHHVAFVLTTRLNGEERIIADARYVVDEDTGDKRAEFAIMVEDQWQRFGLAEHAMHALTTAAYKNGLRWLHGDVLAENCPMLALMERCHFRCTPDRTNEKIVHTERILGVADQVSTTPAFAPFILGNILLQRLKSARGFIQQLLHGDRYA